jgi:hypothetical protein
MTPAERAAAIDEARERIYDLTELIEAGHAEPRVLRERDLWARELLMLEMN